MTLQPPIVASFTANVTSNALPNAVPKDQLRRCAVLPVEDKPFDRIERVLGTNPLPQAATQVQ